MDRPDTVVERQVEAYNRRDLDAFAATYAPNVVVYDHPATVVLEGIDALRATYADRFANSPDLRATISTRIVHGNYVIDHETVTGFMGDRTMSVVATYRIERGAIAAVWFIR